MSTGATGTIVQCIGAVVDIEFPRDQMPEIYDALVLEADPTNTLVEQGLTFEVQQQLGDGIVRTIAMGSSDGLRRGMKAKNTGAGITVPVGTGTLGRIMDVLGRPIDDAGPIKSDQKRAIHQPAPKFDELSPSVELLETGIKVHTTAIGNRGFGFLQRLNASIVSHYVQIGDRPHMEKLIGPVKALIDKYADGRIDAVYVAYSRFVNTMKQEPVIEQLLPLSAESLLQSEEEKRAYSWDYIYEPDAPAVIDALLVRYAEALIYQAVAENMASEQSARMVAMKSASDNAKNVIGELKLAYNKARQAAITKELSEIVSGAAAV